MEFIVNDLRKYIEEKGIKARTISNKIGIPEATIYNILSGKRKMMTDEFFNICDVLGISPDFFYQRFLMSKGGKLSAASDVD